MAAEAFFYSYLVLGCAVAFGFILAWSRRYHNVPGSTLRAEVLPALVVVGTALLGVAPLLGRTIVGSGDAYHYALQAADFIAQVKAGVFPVLVGQSTYGFNGNIHTLRTAPYYVHLCGLIQLGAAGHLTVYRVQALAAIVSALGGAVTAWLAVRTYAHEERLRSALLAALYVTAPGIFGALFGRDMYATYMTLPWIPLVVLGAVQCAARARPIAPLLLLTGALALVWYAHPPTGVLLAPLAAGAVIARLAAGPRRIDFLLALIPVAAGFLLLTAYLFNSVDSMQLSYRVGASAETGESVVTTLPALWPGLLLPLSHSGGASADMQPGYAVLGLGLLLLFFLRPGRRGAWFLGLAFTAYLASIIPWAGSTWFWEHVPVAVISVINPTPHQRLQPIMAAIAIVGAGVALGSLRLRAGASRLLLGALGVAVVWNGTEMRHFWPATQPDAAGTALVRQNVYLTRSSYLLFGTFPAYFSNNVMDPEQECRLLDSHFAVEQSDAAFLFANLDPDGGWNPVGHNDPIELEKGRGYALQFRFATAEAVGQIVVGSGAMIRGYDLPLSGMPRAFGSTPTASKVILLQPEDLDGHLLRLTSTVAGASMRLVPIVPARLPLELVSLIPFTVRVHNHGSSYLEVPKVLIPGYSARVNGQPTPIVRSPQGLLAVAVPPGDSTVQILYTGTPSLKLTYYLSLASLFLWVLATVAAYRWEEQPIRVGRPVRVIATFGGCGLIATTTILILATFQPTEGSVLRMTLTMPMSVQNPSEPLVSLGRTGSGDVIEIRYVGTHQFQLSYDHWSRGGPSSGLMSYEPGQTFEFVFHLPSLLDPTKASGKDRTLTRVAANGRNLLSGHLPWYPNAPNLVYVGRNPIGASSCSERFTGKIQRVSFER